MEAQLSPMYGIAAEDFDKDGNIDILMGGNFYQSKPEVGIYDASYGILLKGDGKGNFTAVTGTTKWYQYKRCGKGYGIDKIWKEETGINCKKQRQVTVNTILINRNMKTAGSVFIILFMLMACSDNSDMDKYNSLVKKELASNKRVDSIFFGIHFGMTQKIFCALLGDE